MTRKIILAVVMALLLTGCGKTEKQNAEKTNTEVEESQSTSEIETEMESEKPSETESETQTELETQTEPETPMIDKSSWVKDLKVASKTTQMIVVSAKDTHATISMHTKDANGVWQENFSVAGRLGRNGIGKEKEGDGKTPVGIYEFMAAFGIKDNPGVSVLPYLKVDETHHWVDDVNSKYYNQCVSTQDVEVDWTSSEHLYKYAPSYHYALALNYNEECVPGVGCAIFLHCPSASFGTTAGCIAIPEENMIQVMQLLQEDCVIIIDSEANLSNY